MRLLERAKRDVTLYDCAGMDDDAYLWGEGRAIRAAVYPRGKSLGSAVYGDRIKNMRLMLYDGEEELCEGMGVRVDKEDGPPDYRIQSVEAWDHQAAVLEWIPEGRRGDGN